MYCTAMEDRGLSLPYSLVGKNLEENKKVRVFCFFVFFFW